MNSSSTKLPSRVRRSSTGKKGEKTRVELKKVKISWLCRRIHGGACADFVSIFESDGPDIMEVLRGYLARYVNLKFCYTLMVTYIKVDVQTGKYLHLHGLYIFFLQLTRILYIF